MGSGESRYYLYLLEENTCMFLFEINIDKKITVETYLQGARLRLNMKTIANNATFLPGVNVDFFFNVSFWRIKKDNN